MDWSGPAAAAWFALQGLQREPWFAAASFGVIALLMGLLLWQLLRLRRLRKLLAGSTDPARTLFQAVITTRDARLKASAAAARAAEQVASPSPSVAAFEQKRRRSGGRSHVPAAPLADAAPCLVKIYIDGSNLQENWEAVQLRNGLIDAGVDWDALPRLLIDDVARRPDFAGRQIVYCGAHIYGSYFPSEYYDLLERLETGAIKSTPIPYMEFRRSRVRADVERAVSANHPGRAAEVERLVRARMLAELDQWRQTNQTQIELLARGLPNRFGYRSFPFERRVRRDLLKARYNSNGLPQAEEKGLDVRCCTDLMADGVFDIFDVAVIITNDSDFVPAIAFVKEELGKFVIQLGPRTMSDAVRAASSGHIDLEDLIKQVNVSRPAARPAAPAAPMATPVPAVTPLPTATRAPASPMASPADPIPPIFPAAVPVKSA